MEHLGDVENQKDELDEIRRDIVAIVSKLDLLIASSQDPAASEER